MIRIGQLKLSLLQEEKELPKKAAKLLKIKEEEIKEFHIVKRSLDARKKPDLFFSYTVDVKVAEEEKVFKRCHKENISIVYPKPYQFPKADKKPARRPVIAGMGPAGLFCAYFLATAGFSPLILERGKDVDARQKDVEAFWNTGVLNPQSNVQFGEGGAGTFSDGKLNTLVKDKYGRNAEVLRLFVKFGAPKEILYDNKPHIGTDILCRVVKAMREEIIRLGGEVRFESMVTDILSKDGKLTGITVNGTEQIEADTLVLAVGHSARNTFEMLYGHKIPMEAKPFAVGVRVEHSQEMINLSQYGMKNSARLSAAPYKAAAKTKDGRGVYSFCMCPGGYVVNASSEEGRLCVNGMSYSARDGKNANSAIIVTVEPKDFGAEHPLAGVEFQRGLEEKAFLLGNGKVPVMTYGSFRAEVTGQTEKETGENALTPSVKGKYVFADITQIFPSFVNSGIVDGMEQFARKISGFNREDTLLSAVESRTSSPIRILRDENLQSQLSGIYPCGEGAGYAGGITSAAMDGIKVAEQLCKPRIDGSFKIKYNNMIYFKKQTEGEYG